MAHRPSASLANSNTLASPLTTAQHIKAQRRMTSPAISAPSSSLNPPESTYGHQQQLPRPPSPLRKAYIPDTSTGIVMSPDGSDGDDDDDDTHWRRSPSPSPSIQKLAANFAQRVGSFMGGMSPRSPTPTLPTDAELEAEAERERDRSRREAERILTQEAEERRAVEAKVLAMMANTRSSPASNSKSLPPPGRSQPSPNPPSPSPSQKEGGTSWWAAAKNKLTSTKEPLTPAQQIIQETKAREKEQKKNNGKGKEKEKEWPAVPTNKDPALLNLNLPPLAIPRKPVPTSPSSPTPLPRNLSNAPPNLTPSPMRPSDATISSPGREAPPLYAQFNSQGTLDVHGTLLMIAKRFEKLEKWTVGHVRALEERMSDVERWLVDKEKEKEKEEMSTTRAKDGEHDSSSQAALSREVNEIREDVSELQGRVGELGREIAKLATSPANLSSGPSREPAQVIIPDTTSSSITIRSLTTTPRVSSTTTGESTSPAIASNTGPGLRSRLPYPTGDYASPPDSGLLTQDAISPLSSPTSSINSAKRPHLASTSGLPPSGVGLGLFNLGPTSSGLPISTDTRPASPLSPPRAPALRQSSASPTPRKRYTVALGNPIVSPAEREKRSGTPPRPGLSVGTAFFSSEPAGISYDSDSATEDGKDDTIGKSAANRFTNGNNSHKFLPSPSSAPSANSPPNHRKGRAQSVYGLSSIAAPSPVTPLNPRLRSSRSTDRFPLPTPTTTTTLNGKFVDPLVLRKQEKDAAAMAGGAGKPLTTGKAPGKIPVGQLVAFFDGEK